MIWWQNILTPVNHMYLTNCPSQREINLAEFSKPLIKSYGQKQVCWKQVVNLGEKCRVRISCTSSRTGSKSLVKSAVSRKCSSFLTLTFSASVSICNWLVSFLWIGLAVPLSSRISCSDDKFSVNVFPLEFSCTSSSPATCAASISLQRRVLVFKIKFAFVTSCLIPAHNLLIYSIPLLCE